MDAAAATPGSLDSGQKQGKGEQQTPMHAAPMSDLNTHSPAADGGTGPSWALQQSNVYVSPGLPVRARQTAHMQQDAWLDGNMMMMMMMMQQDAIDVNM